MPYECRASDFPREYDGACLQMRMSYSPAAHLFLFLVQWTDCHLAGALGLLRILIYKVQKLGLLFLPTWFPRVLKSSSSFIHIAIYFSSCHRFMWMAPQQCLPMKEKQALENSMVSVCAYVMTECNSII